MDDNDSDEDDDDDDDIFKRLVLRPYHKAVQIERGREESKTSRPKGQTRVARRSLVRQVHSGQAVRTVAADGDDLAIDASWYSETCRGRDLSFAFTVSQGNTSSIVLSPLKFVHSRNNTKTELFDGRKRWI